MAETRKDDGRSLADRLVADPKNPPDLSMLQGWLGASSEEKHRRLYLDPELSQSLEIPEDAIVHTQDIPADVNPLGGTWVWVKADAAIKQGPGIERAYARFLRGQIQQDFFAAGAGAGGGVAGGAAGGFVGGPGQPTRPPLCVFPTTFNCPTQKVWCRPSVFTLCPTRSFICPTRPVICQQLPSLTGGCVTRFCPSAVDACPSAPGGCFDPGIVDPGPFQPGAGGFAEDVFQGGGLGFDPGAAGGGFAAGGFVGAPLTQNAACPPPQQAVSQAIICRPSVFAPCPTQLPHLCITQTVRCRTLVQPWCHLPSASPVQCPITLPPPCPVLSRPPQFCPPRTIPPQCPFPSSLLGCPSGFVCDPGGDFQNPVINPGDGGFGGGFAGGFDAGGLGFDPNAGADLSGGGFVGGPQQGIQLQTSFIGCQYTRVFCPRTVLIQQCYPTFVLQQCITRPQMCPVTRFCPTIAGCPSGPVCGGGGFPGGGGIGGGF